MRGSSWLTLLVIVALVVTVGAAVLAYTTARKIASESPVELPALPQFNDTRPTATSVPPTAAPTATQPATPAAGTAAAGSTPAALAGPTTVPGWADPARVTILLMGIDQRKAEKGEFNTDTMMVLSVDPTRKTAVMLSIPRDIYVNIPTAGPMRINRAFAIGDAKQYPYHGLIGGGALAMKTVENLIGVPIQHFVLVNFEVFHAVMDAVGPVQVCPQTAIHDTHYPNENYGFITVDFPAGCQMLNSTRLLQYSRVRHNAGDDFGRAARQQEVIKAVRDKVLSLGGVSSLIGQAGTIWDSVKDNVKTDLKLDDMIKLAQLAQTIDKNNIRSAVLTDRDGFLLPFTLPDGSQILTPIAERVHDLVTVLFDAAPGSSSPAAAENATLQVSNGTGISGLGQAIADKLKGDGFNVISVQNANTTAPLAKSQIKVYTGKAKTAQYLASSLALDPGIIADAQNGPV
ncbi:MAG TPA: LCP family protein, partial [Aggregatilineales bacterium]|nr:LCP family protein [Aggregatilineales bacterium]